ncbi:hypothetical protein SKAU_G00008970 [Synaphobranchus kaupii]|uniref:Uncharacterized protein n=1 Tax=Synaphobranchus kaupii TaxID=118154 RepID=A0A9Q1G9L1_SYNKA|nr:hypothetical protein SKAU_G00008970 [Synaphobranchus kaupii]
MRASEGWFSHTTAPSCPLHQKALPRTTITEHRPHCDSERRAKPRDRRMWPADFLPAARLCSLAFWFVKLAYALTAVPPPPPLRNVSHGSGTHSLDGACGRVALQFGVCGIGPGLSEPTWGKQIDLREDRGQAGLIAATMVSPDEPLM